MRTSAAVAKKVEDFFSSYPKRSYEQGEHLILADDDPVGVFYLLSGQVRQYDISGNGDEIVVNVFKPGAFFPMSWAVNRTPNEYFFAAASQVQVRIAPAAETVRFVKDNPSVLFDLLGRVYLGTDGLLRRLAHVMGGNAQSRLLFEIALQARRFGQPSSKGFLVKLNESELGARAGLSRETVSRELKKLKERKLIKISHAGIEVLDIKALDNLLGSDL